MRKLTEEYPVLSMQHPDDPVYSYLYARSLMGRNTAAAAQHLTEIVANHPEFAPAHGSLAEIYASTVFHDDSKEKAERELTRRRGCRRLALTHSCLMRVGSSLSLGKMSLSS